MKEIELRNDVEVLEVCVDMTFEENFVRCKADILARIELSDVKDIRNGI
jgi:hypothetical protein